MSNNKTTSTISHRIYEIQELLKNNPLQPVIDFNNTNNISDFYLSKSNSDNTSNHTNNSYNTRVVLNKKIHTWRKVIKKLGCYDLCYIKSGTTGHTFKGKTKTKKGDIDYGIKVVAYSKKSDYGKITDIRRPENAELMIIKLLSQFVIKGLTPHIVLPIGMFDTRIETFINEDNVKDEKGKYHEFIKRYKKGELHDKVSILISEWANRGDLLDYIREKYTVITPLHWKVIFFQILSTLAVIQCKYPSFRHNDLKANNILINKVFNRNAKFITYTIAGNVYCVPNIGYDIKLWDFDFACIPGIVENKKVESEWAHKKIGVAPVQNKYYDVHYFFNTLGEKGFCHDIFKTSYISNEVKEFIKRVIPSKYRGYGKDGVKGYTHPRGRLMVNDEYITPDEILKFDPYFKEFRININNKQNKQTSQLNKNNTINNTTKNIIKARTTLPSILNNLDSSTDTDDDIDISKLLMGKKNIKNKNRTISDNVNKLIYSSDS